MGCKKRLKQFIKTFDLFAQPVTFRYGDQPSYESLTGGVCSIMMVIIFIAIFTGTTINTLNKKYITSSITRFEEENPSFYDVGTQQFMFAVSLTGINMNEGDRWFDVYMQFRSYDQNSRNKTFVNLQPCTRSQWTSINESLGSTYDRLGLATWLCPEPGTKFELQGKYTSDIFKFYKFAVAQCNPSFNPSRPCVNDSVIENYLDSQEAFTFNFYFVNTIINAGNLEYLSYYLDDLNYFPFSKVSGVNANLFISSFTVTTDESIMPFEEIVNKTGGVVLAPAQILSYEVRQTEYMKFYIRKSSISLLVERSFRKADDTLSYIGGLFSAILGVLMIMTLYNEFSYQLEIAKNLYHYKKYCPLDSQGFNFFVYLGYLIYMIFDKFGVDLPWMRMRVYHHSLEEVRKQMDIRLIMKKILYSERMAIAVFDEHKAKILHLQEPLTLEEAEDIRKDHRMYEKMERKYNLTQRESQERQKIKDASEMKLDGTLDLIPTYKNSPKKIKSLQRNNQIMAFEIQQELQKQNQQQQQQAIDKQLSETDRKQKQKEDQQLEKAIENMKTYIKVLKREAESGDTISERILEKFDAKLMRRFILEDEENNLTNTKYTKVQSIVRQRRLNSRNKKVSPDSHQLKKRETGFSLPKIRAVDSDFSDSHGS